jgi:ATP-dependent DNA helicase RecG
VTERRHLDDPLSVLAGVGPARAAALSRMGLETLRDLLLHMPRRLEGSGEELSVAAAREALGRQVIVSGLLSGRRFHRFGRRSTLRLTLQDGEDQLELVFFNQPWQRHGFEKGAAFTFSGVVRETSRGPAIVSPRFAPGLQALQSDEWSVVYGTTAGVGQELLRRLVAAALELCRAELEERLPGEYLARCELPSLADAVAGLHAPSSPQEFRAARRRVLLEVLLPIQARARARLRGGGEGSGALRVERGQGDRFRGLFPFELTQGQREVIAELDRDLARGEPMRRLLQGDVGSGKTVLGLYACMSVAAAGGQAAFMAPTELLAEQHHAGLAPLLERAGLRAAVLTGSLRAPERRRVRGLLESGELDVVFGTHALISKGVRYARLALAVIDEQHRFGVAQRARLVEKGEDAHLLLMTATPIPRTLALTIYGDLDVSVLRERPPGRAEITTRWLKPKDARRTPELLRERLEQGEQVYWVCPRIGDDEEAGALRAHARLAGSQLAQYGVELVHGRMASEERAARLERFRRGEVQLLVATPVIEVGVDVPRATVLVVEDSERLGLAQLHQLRGRVGRSSLPSWCLLYGKPVARERLRLLESCGCGFELAEEDLRLRGMGELAGTRQSGELGGLLSDLEQDLDLLTLARDLFAQRPELVGAYHSPTGAQARLR